MSVISNEENKNNNFSQEQIENRKQEYKSTTLSFDKVIIPSIKKKEYEIEKIEDNENKKEKHSSAKNIPMIHKTNKSDSYSSEEKDVVFSINQNNESPEILSKIINIDSTEREKINKYTERKNKLSNKNNSKYKYCIIWSHIPLITFLIPFIGHSSIVNSYGFIHDFDSSYFIKIYN